MHTVAPKRRRNADCQLESCDFWLLLWDFSLPLLRHMATMDTLAAL